MFAPVVALRRSYWFIQKVSDSTCPIQRVNDGDLGGIGQLQIKSLPNIAMHWLAPAKERIAGGAWK